MKQIKQVAYNQGFQANTTFDNPYWIEYPKPSTKGHLDELCARAFVDGFIHKAIQDRHSPLTP